MKETEVSDTIILNGQKEQRPWYRRHPYKTLIRGVIISLPFLILLFLLKLFFELVAEILSPISALLDPDSPDPHWFVHVISFLILIAIFYFIGYLVRDRSRKEYFKYVEKEYLCKVPLYTIIRDMVQQFTGVKQMPFKQVVLVDAFGTGILLTGFVTERVTEDMYTVFVPTAPNPTNGNIYHVPATRLKFLKVGAESAMRTIIGIGVGSSCLFTPKELKKIEEAI